MSFIEKLFVRHLRICICVLGTMALHSAEAGAEVGSASLVVSGDGDQVSDARSKLIWSRCVEGMQWDGKTCMGEPTFATHAHALSLARARAKAEGVGWRVPRVKELQRLVSAPKYGAAVFPAAPPGWYWTASANIDTRAVNQYDYGNIERGVTEGSVNRMAFLHGWAVDAQSAQARGDVPKRTKLPVRLVRPDH